MKVTAKIKNLKNNIVGYFSREQLSLDDKFLDVINNISPVIYNLRGTQTTLVESNGISIPSNLNGQIFIDLNSKNPETKNIYIGLPSTSGKLIVYCVLPKEKTNYHKINIVLGNSYPYYKNIEVNAQDEDHLLRIDTDSSKNMSVTDLGIIARTYCQEFNL